jgi:hypothetical protein
MDNELTGCIYHQEGVYYTNDVIAAMPDAVHSLRSMVTAMPSDKISFVLWALFVD